MLERLRMCVGRIISNTADIRPAYPCRFRGAAASLVPGSRSRHVRPSQSPLRTCSVALKQHRYWRDRALSRACCRPGITLSLPLSKLTRLHLHKYHSSLSFGPSPASLKLAKTIAAGSISSKVQKDVACFACLPDEGR